MEQFITIASFNERAPADRLTERLREAGFNADVFDESAAQKWLMLNLTPRAHMRVRVNQDEGERAAAMLKTLEGEGLMAAAVRCPQCSSSRVEYPQFSRRTLMSALPAAAAAAGLIDREYYCEACGFTWPEEERVEPKTDALNWPEGSKFP